MTGALTYSGAIYPVTGEANDPPADFLRFGNGIDQLLVLKATDLSDRNAKYANVAAGTLVSCASLQTVWMKTTTPPTAAAWFTLAENTTVTTGVATAATDFTIAGGDQWALRRNGFVSVWVRCTYGSGTDIVGANVASSAPGNITDKQLCTITTDYRPVVGWPIAWKSTGVGGWGKIATNGVVTLNTSVPSGVISAGDLVEFAATWPGA